MSALAARLIPRITEVAKDTLEHAGWVGLVDRIVAGKGAGVVGLEDGIAAEEAADHRIIDACAEIDALRLSHAPCCEGFNFA